MTFSALRQIIICVVIVTGGGSVVLAAGTGDNGVNGQNGVIGSTFICHPKFAISPTIGATDTQVTISNGDCPFTSATVAQITFGSTLVPNYTVQSNGTIVVFAPGPGLNDATVPVAVALSDGTVVGGAATTFTYYKAEMDLTGPLPVNPAPVGETNSQWANFANHTMPFNLPISPPNNVLMFGTTSPVLYVSVNFTNSGIKEFVAAANPGGSQVNPNMVIGDLGAFAATLQVCNLTATPAQAAAQFPVPPFAFNAPANVEGGAGGFNPNAGCINWDGNTGFWTNVGNTQQVTLAVNDQGEFQSVTGDLALPAGGAFDIPAYDYSHTFRMVLSVAELDAVRGQMANRNDTLYSLPFQIVLSPTAFVQLKVLPFVIIYAPPGNLSTATFATTANFNTNYSLSNSDSTSNTSAQDVSGSTEYSAKVTLGAAGESVAGSASTTDSFDNSTQQGYGTLTGGSSMNMSTQLATTTVTLYANPATTPGDGQTCASATDCSARDYVAASNWFLNQPFWNDEFQLLVHPQFVTYVIGSGKDRYVYWAADPVLASIQVWQLSACANNANVANAPPPCLIPYSYQWLNKNNQSIEINTSLTLTAQEAANLLQLDPFAAAGTQNVPLDASRASVFPGPQLSYGTKCEMPGGTTTCKAQTPQGYGTMLTNTQLTATGTNGQQSYTSTVTNILGASNSIGSTLSFTTGLVSEAFGIQSTNANKSTVTAQTQAIYGNSTATSTTLTGTDTVTLNDCDTTSQGSCVKSPHLPLPQLPRAQVYLDKMYGGFMFDDPGAPLPGSIKLPLLIAGLSSGDWLSLATAGEQSRPRFPDVPKALPKFKRPSAFSLLRASCPDCPAACSSRNPC